MAAAMTHRPFAVARKSLERNNMTFVQVISTSSLIALSFLHVGNPANPFHAAIAEETPRRPNIVVIMVDDLGYSDLGCYGGEIETPRIDALAKSGLRFSQFYNTAKCHSSRVCLLTGQYCIAAGDTSMKHAVTSAEVLGQNGYFTAMTGKWHLKEEPTDFGFDRYFGHLSGACNFFKGDKTFRLNGKPWNVPEQGFYTTVADVDFALQFLKEARTEHKPFYLYIAFNAPHAPLHALPEDYAKYKGRYDAGWDVIREARVAKQKHVGLLSEELSPSPRPEHVPAWNDLKEWQQKYEANRITTLAAMIDRVDQEVGRLVDDLKANGELDNTFLLFVSDNGACPYDRRKPVLDVEPTNGDISLGDSTGWSWARNSPFRYYKQNQFEGGISTPAIVHWPAGLKVKPGDIVTHPAHLIDVLPTLAEISNSKIPAAWDDRDLRPVSGVSLKPALDGSQPSQRPPIHLLFSQDRGLRDGDWKLVSFQGKAWELYNVAKDRTELHDLAKSEPERLQSMVRVWTQMAKDVLHARPSVYKAATTSGPPHQHREWTNFAAETPDEYVRRKDASKAGSGTRPNAKAKAIRARKNTTLKITGNELRLQFTGDDPGIAMDLRNAKLPVGPYKLTFRLKGGSKDGGEMFFTTNPTVTLPRGERETFVVNADDRWQNLAIDLPTSKQIYQLRLDVCSGIGSATIADLKLSSTDGKVLLAWPASKKAAQK